MKLIVVSNYLSDCLSCLVTIHDRHVAVHQYQLVEVVMIPRVSALGILSGSYFYLDIFQSKLAIHEDVRV